MQPFYLLNVFLLNSFAKNSFYLSEWDKSPYQFIQQIQHIGTKNGTDVKDER